MPRPSVIQLAPEDAAASARVEHMLDVAEFTGPHPGDLARVRHRLVANEHEREGMSPSPRRDELDRAILDDLEEIALAIVRWQTLVERMPEA